MSELIIRGPCFTLWREVDRCLLRHKAEASGPPVFLAIGEGEVVMVLDVDKAKAVFAIKAEFNVLSRTEADDLLKSQGQGTLNAELLRIGIKKYVAIA